MGDFGMKMTGKDVIRWQNSILPTIVLAAGLIGISGFAAAPAQAAGPGAEVCKNCHTAQVQSYQATKHGTKGDPRSPANAGECSTCHGDATAHVKAGGGKGVGGIVNPASKTLAPEDQNKICMTCHRKDSNRSHWEGSTHDTRGTACVSCHTLHSPDKVRNKLTQSEVCFTCHKQQRTEVNRPSRHPILEGKVACSDCHNPHGSAGPKLMKRDSVVDTCYQCHAEKRGPFVHQHEPVVEDCSNCHNPHGTTAENMLKMRPPFLCHQCHTPHGGQILVPAGTPGAPTSGKNYSYAQGRGCLTCHTQVHGGNNPSFTNPTVQFMFR
jgi:DmsE family decaheme c-type cytochrome